jgi:hypothetical protein
VTTGPPLGRVGLLSPVPEVASERVRCSGSVHTITWTPDGPNPDCPRWKPESVFLCLGVRPPDRDLSGCTRRVLRWQRTGIGAGWVWRWIHDGVGQPEVAATWWRVSPWPPDALKWRELGLRARTCTALWAEGWHPASVGQLLEAGFSPATIRRLHRGDRASGGRGMT